MGAEDKELTWTRTIATTNLIALTTAHTNPPVKITPIIPIRK